MTFIVFTFLVLVALIYLLVLSYKRKWNLKDMENKSSLAILSTFRYYFWLIVLIITMICLIYNKIVDFIEI